jgi:hypothetical protein
MGRFWKQHGLNRETVNKMYLAGGDLSTIAAGGRLDPEQQLDTLNAIRAMSGLLGPVVGMGPRAAGPGFLEPTAAQSAGGPTPAPGSALYAPMGGPGVSFINVTSGRTSGVIEGFVGGGYVVEGATEATAPVGAAPKVLTPRAREWVLRKLHMWQQWSQEITWQSILEDRFGDFLFENFFPLVADNLEQLALFGDMNNAEVSPKGNLLRAADGWLKAMRAESKIHDAGGEFISEDLFFELKRVHQRAIQLYRSATNYLFCNPAVIQDWLQVQRAVGQGSLEAHQALFGQAIGPLGMQFWPLPLLNIDEEIVQSTAAVGARVIGIGGKADQFQFPTTNYQLTLNVNGAGAVTVSFPHQEAAARKDRTLSITRVCNLINAALVAEHGDTYAKVARENNGRLELVTPGTGAGQAIVISDGGLSAHALFGFTLGTTSGVAANGGGSTYNGTTMFLGAPSNLEMRVSTAPEPSNNRGYYSAMKWLQENDTFRFDAYMHASFNVRVPEAMVLVENLRVAGPGENPAA